MTIAKPLRTDSWTARHRDRRGGRGGGAAARSVRTLIISALICAALKPREYHVETVLWGGSVARQSDPYCDLERLGSVGGGGGSSGGCGGGGGGEGGGWDRPVEVYVVHHANTTTTTTSVLHPSILCVCVCVCV